MGALFIDLNKGSRIMSEQQTWGIMPCSKSIDISKGYSRLELSPTQEIQIGSLLQQLPSAAIAGAMPQFYTVSFPNGGCPANLMRFQDGGAGSPVMGENGIVTHASFHSMEVQALVMGCFTVMSIASSQYFLKQIGNELQVIKFGLDKILEFLYGDKKAELMSEVSFIKYAYQNYTSIMSHEYQRTAMIGSIHNAKKVAMKDIEFYMTDLNSIITAKGGNDIGTTVEKAFQIKDSLELAMQLYGMSSLLEVHYSQNFDSEYIKFVEKDISVYIDKCEKQMLGNFSALKILLDNAKGPLFRKMDKYAIEKQINEFIESLNQGGESELRKSLKASLNIITQKPEYVMSRDGGVYLKTVG